MKDDYIYGEGVEAYIDRVGIPDREPLTVCDIEALFNDLFEGSYRNPMDGLSYTSQVALDEAIKEEAAKYKHPFSNNYKVDNAMQNRDNVENTLHGGGLTEDVKKPFSHDERVFVTVKGMTKVHIVFLGNTYTHRQFEYMLKFMSRSLFMYPESLVDTDKPDDDNKVNGFVVTKGFAQITDTKDVQLVKATDDYKKTYEELKHHPSETNAIVIFSDRFISDLIEDLQDVLLREAVAYRLNEVFVKFAKDHVCDACGVIGNNKVLTRQENDTKDSEGMAVAGVKSQARLCGDCSKGMLKVNQAVTTKTLGRNEPCACGSGKKFKKCGLIKACPMKKDDSQDKPNGKAAAKKSY